MYGNLLTLTTSARPDAPFTLAGARALVTGFEATGIRKIFLNASDKLHDLKTRDAHCVSFRIMPGVIERELDGAGTRVIERIVVAPDDPAVAVQWVTDTEVSLAVVWQSEPDGASSAEQQANTWPAIHAARAQRRYAEWLRIVRLNGTTLDAFEWAKYRLSSYIIANDDVVDVVTGYGVAGADVADESGKIDVIRALLALGDLPTVRAMLSRYPMLRPHYDAVSGDANSGADTWQDAAAGEVPPADWLSEAHSYQENQLGAWGTASYSDDALRTARLVNGMAFGILGIAPDAARGRLQLRPRLPEDWTQLRVDNIRVGDALVSMEYERTKQAHHFILSQTSGAYPVRLIFEPAVVRPVTHAFVDGVLATLDLTAQADRVVAPVQIVLDERRVVDLQY